MTQPRPCPTDFAATYVAHGPTAAREAYGARADQFRRWVAECGETQLREARQRHKLESAARRAREADAAARRDKERGAAERLAVADLDRSRVRRATAASYGRGRTGQGIHPKERAVRAAAQHLRHPRVLGRAVSPVRSLDYMGKWRLGAQVVTALELLNIAVRNGLTDEMIPGLSAHVREQPD